MGEVRLQFPSLVWGDARHGWVDEYPPVQKLHDVERGPDHALVFAQAYGPWNRHVCLLQRMDDLVLSLDPMGRLGQQLARRFLAKHVFRSVSRGELVRRVALAKPELHDVSFTSRKQEYVWGRRACLPA